MLFTFGPGHRVHTEWQWPLSGVHSIMMEKLVHPGEDGGGGCTPTAYHYIYHYVRICGVRSSWGGRYTPHIFYSTTVCNLRSCSYLKTTGNRRKNNLEFRMESLLFIKADHYVSFCEFLFYVCVGGGAGCQNHHYHPYRLGFQSPRTSKSLLL